MLVTTNDGVELFSSACPEPKTMSRQQRRKIEKQVCAAQRLREMAEAERVIQTPPPASEVSLKYQSKVKQILDNLKGKLLKEVGGGPDQAVAFLADEAKRIDPELGQLPREELTRSRRSMDVGGRDRSQASIRMVRASSSAREMPPALNSYYVTSTSTAHTDAGESK